MARLVECPRCREHIRRTEQVCPHCDAVVLDERGGVIQLGQAIVLGLALTACPSGDDDDDTNTSVEPEYGVPATESVSDSATSGMSSTSVGTNSATGTESSSTDVGEPEYGVPETFTETGTSADTGGSSDTTGASTDGSTSVEPDYGLPDSG